MTLSHEGERRRGAMIDAAFARHDCQGPYGGHSLRAL